MKKLNDLRSQINQIDEELKKLFFDRLDIARQIGEYKKSHNLPILDEVREHEIISKINDSLAENLDKERYLTFVKMLIKLSKEVQL